MKLQPLDKKGALVDLVSDLIEKLNNDQQDLAQSDSKSLKYVHDEMERLTKMVANFVEQSAGIICSEGKAMTFLIL